ATAMEAEARSSGKRLSYLVSKHKFHPEGMAKASSRAPLVRISSTRKAKRRPAENSQVPQNRQGIGKKISSRSAIVLDSETGEVIYSLRPDRPAQPASTIKILTGLIAIQSLEDQDWVSASRRAAGMPRSKIYIKHGKSYRAGDMINAVLLSSANDASVALAEKIAGSERVFAKLMTHKAKAWGAENTVCKTASGLTARGQKSTARDLAVLFNRAMENDEFAKRIGRKKVRTGYGKLLRNHNRALWRIEGSEGGKTGFTKAARQTYVGKFKRGDDELTVAVMGSVTMWDDIKNLVEYGFGQKKREEMFTAAAK
ncbi:MAG: serine hydrolase, partial [Thermodesulfobacteriota bacterium]